MTQIKQALEITDEQKLGNQLTGLTERVERVDAQTERGMKQLQQQMNELKQVLLKPNNDPPENQLKDWLQKMEQTNANLHQQLQQMQQQMTQMAQTVSEWETRQPLESVNSQAEGKEVRELTESPTSQKPLSTSEELLIHLGPLLDDF